MHLLRSCLDTLRNVVVLFMIAPIAVLNAQTDTTSTLTHLISLEVRKQFGTRAQLDATIARAYGTALTPEKVEVARNFMGSVLRHEALPASLARIIAPLTNGSHLTPRDVENAVSQGILQLQLKGLARLPTDKQAAFVQHMVSLARTIRPSDCKALYLGHLDANASVALERRYIATLPLGRFEAVTALYRQAIEAELAGYPDVKTINAQQAKLAEKAHQGAMAKRLQTQVPVGVVQRVSQDGNGAPAADVCAFFSATTEAMLDIAEPYRTWQLTRFMESIQ